MSEFIAIIGSGIAGLATGQFLQRRGYNRFHIFEAKKDVGGVASSYKVDGFTFDYGIHGLYTKHTEVFELLSDAIAGEHLSFDCKIADYWHSFECKHPIYHHLKGLPNSILFSSLHSFVNREQHSLPSTLNFDVWCRNKFGDVMAKEFILPYISKFWATDPKELTSDWMGGRIKVPELVQLLRGAVEGSSGHDHYVRRVYYPNSGGFGSYASALSTGLPITTNAKVEKIYHREKIFQLNTGELIKYDRLVSTVPLPMLVSLLPDIPDHILRNASLLRATSLALISLGISRSNVIDHHWVYVLDKDISIARLSSPSLWSNNGAPKGMSSLQAEVYYTGKRPGSITLLNNVCDELRTMGILLPDDKFVVTDVKYLDYANVIHDHNRKMAVDSIHDYMLGNGIMLCGRYAEWGYDLIDDVILSASSVVDNLVREIYR